MGDHAQAMSGIVSAVHPLLERVGFHRRRNTFNRETEPGFIQVVDFHMRVFESGRGSRWSPVEVHGRFTVTVGIFVKEIYQDLFGSSAGDFVGEDVCELRKPLSELLPRRDRPVTNEGMGWWSLDAPPSAKEIELLLAEYVLPLFARLSGRRSLVAEWHRSGDALGLSVRAPISIATILFHRGDLDGADRLVRQFFGKHREVSRRRFVDRLASSLTDATDDRSGDDGSPGEE